MRVVGESKTVDLSKKLTVEMTLGELAYISAMVNAQTQLSGEDEVKDSWALQKRYKDDIKRHNNSEVYAELHKILKAEGVTK